MARNYFCWPYLDEDIEAITAVCTICLESCAETPKISLTTWQWPSKPWSRMHTDFLGPFHGNMFLLVVDAHSKRPEVFLMKNNTQASKLISVFRILFSRFRIPEHVVSDNGTNYKSAEFRECLKINGVKHTFSPPYHPATNGATENFVKTFKDKVDKIIRDNNTLDQAVNLFLSDYNN